MQNGLLFFEFTDIYYDMNTSLGDKLKQVRKLKGLSLRDVEAKTGISNAYLSQLERADASNPSPKKLKSLAEYYDIPYADLLNLAGYLPKNNDIQHNILASSVNNRSITILSSAIQSAELTEDEESLVAQYITFLKTQRK